MRVVAEAGQQRREQVQAQEGDLRVGVGPVGRLLGPEVPARD